MKEFFTFLFLFISTGVFSQTNLDSLWNVWNNKEQSDTSRLEALNNFTTDGYLESQPDSAFYFAQIAYDYARDKGLDKQMADALHLQGRSLWRQSEYDSALNYYTQALTIREEIEDIKGIASSLNNIGLIYNDLGEFIRAIDYYTRALSIREELGELTEKQQQLITILELIRLEEFLCSGYGYPGRPPADRTAIARAFVAKQVYNMPTTRVLLDRLQTDQQLRRICGWERRHDVPKEWTFSRAFA